MHFAFQAAPSTHIRQMHYAGMDPTHTDGHHLIFIHSTPLFSQNLMTHHSCRLGYKVLYQLINILPQIKLNLLVDVVPRCVDHGPLILLFRVCRPTCSLTSFLPFFLYTHNWQWQNTMNKNGTSSLFILFIDFEQAPYDLWWCSNVEQAEILLLDEWTFYLWDLRDVGASSRHLLTMYDI